VGDKRKNKGKGGSKVRKTKHPDVRTLNCSRRGVALKAKAQTGKGGRKKKKGERTEGGPTAAEKPKACGISENPNLLCRFESHERTRFPKQAGEERRGKRKEKRKKRKGK